MDTTGVQCGRKRQGDRQAQRPEAEQLGRWGELDERGTVNFITEQLVADAARLIQRGRAISCAVPLDSTGPVHPTRPGPVHLYGYTGADFAVGSEFGRSYPNFQGSDDYIFMPLQGSTQWDGLSHFFEDDTMYNGFWIGNVEAFAGARRCSIHRMKNRLSGRGVLLDLPRHQGVDRLSGGHGITATQLDACAEAQQVEVRTGDILLVRTGHVPWFYELADKAPFWSGGAPGMTGETVAWVHERQIAALAMDNVAVEVEPFEDPHDHVYPLHARFIRDLGPRACSGASRTCCARPDRRLAALSSSPAALLRARHPPCNASNLILARDGGSPGTGSYPRRSVVARGPRGRMRRRKPLGILHQRRTAEYHQRFGIAAEPHRLSLTPQQ